MDCCILCDISLDKRKHLFRNKLFYVILDDNPVSEGHCLIVPSRHVETFSELKMQEVLHMKEMIDKTRRCVYELHKPDGFNIGINEGISAGQTIEHLHIHFIPRYKGDLRNPRGGVRGVIPSKRDYKLS
jgi:diadenosine tetraphosphate (Ap4A) HIT family hydrolase